MSSGSEIRAGRAYVELFTKDGKLHAGLRSAKRSLHSFGASVRAIGKYIAGIGMALAAPLAAAVTMFSDFGSELNDMSARTGIAVEALSGLRYAAKLAGVEIEALEVGIKKMQKFIDDAAGGSKEAAETLASLGLSAGQLKRMSPDVQMAAIADQLLKIPDPGHRAAVAMKVFGKSGTAMLPMLDDLAAKMERAKQLGLIFSTEDAAAADAFGDALDELWMVLKAGVFHIGAALAPMLTELVLQMSDCAAAVSHWIKEHRGLIVSVTKMVALVIAAGAAIYALGAGFTVLGSLLGAVSGGLLGVGVVIKGVLAIGSRLYSILFTPLAKIGAMIWGVVTKAAAAVAAFAVKAVAAASACISWFASLSLVQLACVGVGAALVAMAGYMLYQSGVFGQAVTGMKDLIADFKADALAAWGGIADALAAGDIALAGKVVWALLKLEWTRGVLFLNELWTTARDFFLSTWDEACARLARFFVNGLAGIESAWVETTAFLSAGWNTFLSGMTQGWRTAQNFISKGILHLMKLFDSSIDVDAASQQLDEDLAKANAATDAEKNKANADIEARRQKRRDDIERDRYQSGQNINDDVSRSGDERRKNSDAALAGLNDDVNRAKSDLDKAVADAREARDKAEKKGGTDKKKTAGQFSPDAIKQSVLGTFSGQNVGRMAGGSPVVTELKFVRKEVLELRRQQADEAKKALRTAYQARFNR